MMINNIFCMDKVIKKSEDIRIIYYYRGVSFLLTSTYYIINNPESAVLYRLGVVISLLISGIIIMLLFENFIISKTQ